MIWTDRQRYIIQKGTKTQTRFSGNDHQGYKPKVIWESDFILPSQYPFRSSQQIYNKIPTIQHVLPSISKQCIQNLSASEITKYPHSCIGLVLCQHHQNNKICYVYSTGTLIHNNIVLTSAQNVYCHKLHSEYVNIKFITGVIGNKCSGIYDVMRVHYPKEYTRQEGYENYNFAVLQLYNDLSDSCGYVGWKNDYKKESKEVSLYGYVTDYKQGYFNLQQLAQGYSGTGKLLKEGNQCYIIGLYMSSIKILSLEMQNIVIGWIKMTILDLAFQNLNNACDSIVKNTTNDLRSLILWNNNINAQGCKYLNQANWTLLNNIDLRNSSIGAKGCMYISQANWIHLANINLTNNNIGAEGCEYLSQTNWKHLTGIYLQRNNITAQGCKNLSKSNWKHLNKINLGNNNIRAQGCMYMSQVNLINLTNIDLWNNNIGAQGCEHLSQANWKHLTDINLFNNNIGAQGCKYLIRAKWRYLTNININNNQIGAQGSKYLSQVEWTNLTNIELDKNNISEQACKYLIHVHWIHKKNTQLRLSLSNNNINIIDKISMKGLCSKIRFQ